jgi:type IX secretion system PorP/SprF family membrane protein
LKQKDYLLLNQLIHYQSPKLKKMIGKRLLFSTFFASFLFFNHVSYAQQQISHSQHGLFRNFYNPASSLLAPLGEVQVIGKQQWGSIDGAPRIFWGSGHVGLTSLASTVGVNVRHQSIGPDKHTDASVFLAKSIRIGEKQHLGGSLNVGLNHFKGSYSQIDPNDPAFREDINETNFNAGFGIMFFQPEKYYIGVSMPGLAIGNQSKYYDFRNVFYAMAGVYVDLGSDIGLRPSILTTFMQNEDVLVEGSALLVLKQQFGVGANVRSQGAMAALAQFQFNGFHIGYSYLFSTGSNAILRQMNTTSHELGLGYRFGGIKGWL